MLKFSKNLRYVQASKLPIIGFFIGLILAQGAPLGLIIHTFIFSSHDPVDFTTHTMQSLSDHLPIYLYVWIGTCLYFSIFGWISGKLLRQRIMDLQRTQSALALFSKFDTLNRQVKSRIQHQLSNPTASLLEFKESLELGLFGKFTDDQITIIKSFLQDIADIHSQTEQSLMNHDYSNCNLEFLNQLSKKHKIIISGTSLQVPIRFDESLLHTAFSEIFTELQQNQEIHLYISESPIPDWPSPNYALITINCEKKKNYGSGWIIAMHIINWNGGALIEQNNGFLIALPRAETQTITTGKVA